MKVYKKIFNYIKPFIVVLCLFLTGCGTIGLAREASFESAYENMPEEEPVNIYTSAARGVVEAVDAQASTVTFYLVSRGEQRTFTYDAATVVQDRYGSFLTMEQLKPGELVEIAYNAELEKMGRVTFSTEGFSYDSISNYALDVEAGSIQIGKNVYQMGNNIKIFSGNEQMEINQILKEDVVSFRGMGHEIVSVIVDKGHGYLKLENEEALIGGWIEVGQTVIQQISENMLITAPEGSYVVRLTAGEIEEYRDVTIERNRETVLDLRDIEVRKPANGMVSFHIYPQEAQVFIDNKEVDASYKIRIPLGIHKITAKAEGYDSFSEYFEVTEGTNTVKMTLTQTTTTISGNESKSDEATLTIQAPDHVEVYQDNLYMGIAPVTYSKTAGEHTITLRKEGYVTKSYQITVADDDKNVIYSFPDLETEEKTATVSGNKVSAGNPKEAENTVSGNAPAGIGHEKTVSGNGLSVSGNESGNGGN